MLTESYRCIFLHRYKFTQEANQNDLNPEMLQLHSLFYVEYDHSADAILSFEYCKSSFLFATSFGLEEFLVWFGVDFYLYCCRGCQTFVDSRKCVLSRKLCTINFGRILLINLYAFNNFIISQTCLHDQKKFNILLLGISMKSQGKKDHEVHIFTEKTCMKFIPKNFEKMNKKNIEPLATSKPTSKIVSRFSFSSLFGRRSNVEPEAPVDESSKISSEGGQNSNKQIQSSQSIPGEQINNHNLKFAFQMTSEYFLIGNEYQLDVINILGVNANNYVQTQYVYSFEYKDEIKHVTIDQKKLNLMAVVAGKTLYVYKYDAKKIMDQSMEPFGQLELPSQVKFLQLAKDGNLCVFYPNKMEVYIIGEEIRRRYENQYAKHDNLSQQGGTYQIFMVPEPFDNIINVFFEQRASPDAKIFTLWTIEYQFLSQIKPNGPKKVYQVKNCFRNSMRIKNYSKQLFLVNLGGEILALKKGYVLDSATVNLKHQSSYLEYIGGETLLHISQKKVQVYSFSINTNIKPFRIVIKSRDSIKISGYEEHDLFFKVIHVSNNQIIVIFQKGTLHSKSKTGEIHYSFFLTRSTTRQLKMSKLFPKGMTIEKIDDPVLLDKCDMAEKMGFTIREIYLQLWSRSLQSKFQDFQILIATKDYNTIKEETIKKLKKASMKLTDIKQIEQLAFKMLNSRVFNPSCTEDVVMDYISSHFFNRKIKMFEKTLAIEKAEKQKKTGVADTDFKYKMTIRQYQQYRSMQIKAQLISLVNQFCHEGKTSCSNNIRLLLQHFKFVFRTIYYELLDEIIKNAKEKLLDLLKQIPELLPYTPPADQVSIEPGFCEGIWPQINKSQWSESLYIDAITTIDNKQIVLEQVIKNINFKRNWLSQHDVVLWSVQKIKANYHKIKSPLTFYFFIAKMFNYVRDQPVLQQIVQFLEKTYELPQNIKGNVFLMEKMYNFFVEKNIVPEVDSQPLTLNEFLAFQDKQYIRHCFEKQRSNKGLLLKDLKDIFKSVLQDQANQKYNNAILNYFTSDLSQVSDLKYILNRINNQKVQFHHQNQEMYEVLVLALEKKLKIGTDDDIPIQQVLIYIENIPLKFNAQPSKSLAELKSVEKIEKQSQMLRKAKVNMSIYDILHNYEQVFTKIIHFQIENAPFEAWQNFESFEQFAISKIALLENFSQQIYNDGHEKDIFFIFLTSLCEKIQRIRFADFLLKNEHFQERLDPNTVQGLVLFMKKWKLSGEKQYVKNEQYIRNLLTLLPRGSDFYTYIQCQLEFAKILSAPDFPVTYPISEIYITASDIRDIIFDLPVSFVEKIPITQLFNVVQKMQDILLRDQQNDEGQQYLTPANRVTLHQIYEFVIIKLINSNKLKQALPLIRQTLSLEIANSTYNIVYLILFSISISNQFNENIRNNIFLCIWYYFYDPISLLEIFQHLIKNPMSSKQIKVYVEQCVAKGKQKHKGYNQQNPIFDEDYIKMIRNKEDEQNFMLTLQKTSRHIQQSKQQFKHVKYTAIMIMLCNSPFALAKFISCSSSYDLHVKFIRSFLSYAIHEKVFKPFGVLQFGKRVFLSLLEASKNKFPIEVVIEKYENNESFDLNQSVEIQGYEPPKEKKNYEYLMWKSADAFKKKKAALQTQNKLKQISPVESAMQKSERLRSQLDKVPNLDERDPCQYPFTQIDSDNEINNQDNFNDEKKKKKEIPKFDKSQQMKRAMKGEGRNNMLFLSTRGQIAHKSLHNNLMISIRQPYKTTQSPIYKSVEGISQLKMPSYNERYILKKGLDHKQSQDFQEIQRLEKQYKTQRDQKLRPASQSAFDSQPKHSADSSPDIIQNKFTLIQGQLQKSQELVEFEFEEKEKVNNSGQASEIKVQETQNMPYEIKIKEVFDAEELAEMNKKIPQSIDFNYSPEIMVESTQFENPFASVCKTLIQQNKQSLQSPFPEYNLDSLKPYSKNKKAMLDIVRQLYRQHNNLANLQKIMKLIGQIVSNFPVCDIDPQQFAIIIKVQEAQAKTIPEIKFNQLMPEASIFAEYNSKRDLFQKLYTRLNKFVDSENIYKITQFIRRVFDNPEFEQEVTWDFILDLADKLQLCEEEERTWTLEKIQGNLPKVDISIWNRSFSIFQIKILTSAEKDSLLKVFCGYLRDKKGNQDAITFLQNLKELDNSEIITETLNEIQLRK